MDVSKLTDREKQMLKVLLPEEIFEDVPRIDNVEILPSPSEKTFLEMLVYLLSKPPYSLRGGKRQLAKDLQTSETNLWLWFNGKSQPSSKSFLRVKNLYSVFSGGLICASAVAL